MKGKRKINTVSKLSIIALVLTTFISFAFSGCASAPVSTSATSQESPIEKMNNPVAVASETTGKERTGNRLSILADNLSSDPQETPSPVPSATPTPMPTATPVPETEVAYETDSEPIYEPEPEEYYEPEPEEYYEPEPETDEQMVYIPRTGECYHSKSTCSNMKNPNCVTLSEAIEWGYRPCKKCW